MTTGLLLPQTDYRKAEIAGWSGAASTPCYDNYDRAFTYTNGLANVGTGVMVSAGIFLPAGAVISNLVFRSGATPANVPTNWWFALFDNAAVPNLLQQTADQLTTAWAANTTMDVALASPVTISSAGLYFAASMMKATTAVNYLGSILSQAAASDGLVAGMCNKAQTSGSGLSTTAPGTIASPAAIIGIPLVTAH